MYLQKTLTQRLKIAGLIGLAVLVFCQAFLCQAWAFEPSQRGDDQLRKLRAERREQQRLAQTSPQKNDGPALFGLLVIPVDFSDARLPDNWQPSPQLGPTLFADSGQTLHNYFNVASGHKIDLRITLAPLVKMPGTRRDYSDVGYFGFRRSRELARTALLEVQQLGLEFRRLDMEGPDRIPGTADDDGQLDGVLILHAGIGQENDGQEGLIQALQFYLDEPVISNGISASSYAVAAMGSGLGIWAHETAHLLGMEDRYDPLLPASGNGSELRSKGGLGRFSLMASGAWGTGDGQQPALPDAYSLLQMGWLDTRFLPMASTLRDTIRPGLVDNQATRIWTNGAVGPEFFLFETRDPELAAPFDAGIPAHQLLVYHVDETVPEGGWSVDGIEQWHLRVRLVEADADNALAQGRDTGRPEDLFPGPLAVTSFSPRSVPSSAGYDGLSHVALQSIESIVGGVVFSATAAEEVAVDFEYDLNTTSSTLDLSVHCVGTPITQLTSFIEITQGNQYGHFTTGDTLTVPMQEIVPGQWIPVDPIAWIEGQSPVAGSETHFEFTFNNSYWTSEIQRRQWVWLSAPDVLDFDTSWPGQWTMSYPSGNTETRWHRWSDTDELTDDLSPVLICTGEAHETSGSWPEVLYAQNANAQLTSGPLDASVQAVRLLHSGQAEILTGTTFMDGATAIWVGPSGQEVIAEPLGNWPAAISSGAANDYAGAGCFLHEDTSPNGTRPLWQCHVLPLPDIPGPWRLRLVFASNQVWRYQGWLLADAAIVDTSPNEADFSLVWSADTDALVWSWPFSFGTEHNFTIQYQTDGQSLWRTLADESFVPDPLTGLFSMRGDRIRPQLDQPELTRCVLRVIGTMAKGSVTSHTTPYYADGGDGHKVYLSRPWPNPSVGQVQFLLNVPVGRSAILRIYDVRGHLVFEQPYDTGNNLVTWDGTHTDGHRLASGNYYLRLEGSGRTETRKVVLLH